MKQIMRALSVVSLSSVFVMQGACTISGDGLSIIPTVPSLNVFLASIPGLGAFFTT